MPEPQEFGVERLFSAYCRGRSCHYRFIPELNESVARIGLQHQRRVPQLTERIDQIREIEHPQHQSYEQGLGALDGVAQLDLLGHFKVSLIAQDQRG